MPTPVERFRAEIYVTSERERQLAHDACERVAPGETADYDGLVEGWLNPDEARRLKAAGLSVAVEPGTVVTAQAEDESEAEFSLSADGEPATAAAPPLAAAAPQPADYGPELARLAAQASAAVPLGFASRSMAESDVSFDAGEEATSEAPVACEVRISGALRPEWRAQLDQLGLEICSYQPPDKYRMLLTPAQVVAARSLPFVQDVTRYGIAETVTPELLEAVRAAGGPAPDDSGTDFTVGGEEEEPALSSDVGAQPPATFDVVLFREQDLPAVEAAIAAAPGAAVLDASGRLLRFQAPIRSPLVGAVAAMEQVQTLAPYEPPSLMANYGRRLSGIEAINTPVDASGLERWTGKGEVVGIFDSGIDATHPDLAPRIKKTLAVPGGSAVDNVGHGTHVAGIIAGTGAESGGKIRGAAPEAELVMIGMVSADGKLLLGVDLGKLLERATEQGAKIINLSWGRKIAGSYDQGSLSIDQFVYDHPDVLVVVAAGNEGRAKEGFSTFNSVGAPATGKNVLTVGACGTGRPEITATWGTQRPVEFPMPPSSEELLNSPDSAGATSSRGPTDEPQRVKPDLLAPGVYVLSTRAAGTPADPKYYWAPPETPCDDYDQHKARYAFLGGTSMAAPAVAGAAAVLRQYLREAAGTADPSAALLKAVLLASVRPLKPVERHTTVAIGYPDFDQGFGRLDLASILPHTAAPAGRQLLFVDISNAAAEALESRMPIGGPRRSYRDYQVKVPPGATDPLRIVLAWTDPPGNGVQNTLQIDVRGPGGVNLTGNPAHQFVRTSLLEEGTAYDRRNNVQQITVGQPGGAAPAAGTYAIHVLAQNTLKPQGYALCVCGQIDGALKEMP